jgi:TolB-like protein/class 3 adenylate cyclase
VAREQRKLAAILAADVVGYSRLMGRDESGTLARLREHRTECLEPALARYGGRLVKLTGDGALVEFASAVDALSAAVEFQQAVADTNRKCLDIEQIVFRVGLHLGDLIVDGDDLYGDGVNIAARLEAEAPPGGIIVSRAVREAVQGRLKVDLHALGELTLKNIDRPIRAFQVAWEETEWPREATATAKPIIAAASLRPAPALPDKPSIAVLPFQNMSGDPEQEYFADGLTEDLITTLSRIRWFFVIARNSCFAYKGRSLDIRDVARELGVAYVLEGSVRKAGTRVRITAQLVTVDRATRSGPNAMTGSCGTSSPCRMRSLRRWPARLNLSSARPNASGRGPNVPTICARGTCTSEAYGTPTSAPEKILLRPSDCSNGRWKSILVWRVPMRLPRRPSSFSGSAAMPIPARRPKVTPCGSPRRP